MIVRHHTKDNAPSSAVYSPCELYRYSLTRTWDAMGARVNFLMLNPSTATEVQNDPTVERCERRARALGFGSFRVTNIFAFRATDPQVMRDAYDPIGPENDTAILEAVHWAGRVICAWGIHGAHLQRGPEVFHMLKNREVPLFHLGLSKAGHPRHPLYISYSVKPVLWS